MISVFLNIVSSMSKTPYKENERVGRNSVSGLLFLYPRVYVTLTFSL